MEQRPYQVVSKEVTEIGRFKVNYDIIKRAGIESPYSYIEVGNSVCILPFYRGRIVMIREYRHALNKWVYEFPAGVIDSGEEPEAAALRELKEETGYRAGAVYSLGQIYPNTGISTEVQYLFRADCEAFEKTELEAGELIETVLISQDELEEMIKDGSFIYGTGLALWLKYKLQLQKG